MLRLNRAWLPLLAGAFVLRAGWGLAHWPISGGAETLSLPDERQYWDMAESLARGGGLRDELGFCAGRMPLFPGLLSLAVERPAGIFWTRAALWLLGAGAAAITARLGARLFDDRVGLVAGAAVALDPYLVYFASLVLTETPFVLALLALWVISASFVERPTVRRGIVVGGLAAVCVYLREAAVAFVAAMLILALLRSRRNWRAVAASLVPALVLIVALVPWALRNHARLGRAVWLTTRGGISLYDGVRSGADGASDLGEIKSMPEVREYITRGQEIEWDRHFRSVAWKAMTDDFTRMLGLVPAKLQRTWNIVPNLEEGRSIVLMAVSALWTVPVYALAGIGGYYLLRGRTRRTRPPHTASLAVEPGRSRGLYVLLPVLVVSALHAVFVGSVRYRLPAMPMVEILAAVGLVELWTARRRPPEERNGFAGTG